MSEKILKSLRIHDLSRGGNGVGRELTQSEAMGSKPARVVFVPFTITGDVVTVKVTQEERRFATAEIVEIESPSPDRVVPPCPVFGICGGCAWQHVPYEMQWRVKSQGVLQALARASVTVADSVELTEFPAMNAWNYRNRVQLRAKLAANGVALGYYARGSNDLVDIPRCDIARPELNALLPEIRFQAEKELRDRTVRGENLPEVKVELEVLPDGSTRSAWNSRHGALGFRQVNDEQNLRLQSFVRENLPLGAPVLDLYGGSGNFTLADAERYSSVDCVDVGSPDDGSIPHPKNFRFFKSDVAQWLERRVKLFRDQGSRPEGELVAILDPPREGLGASSTKIIGTLRNLGVKKVIAIGCDADSWARDTSQFVKTAWTLEKIALFDLFPQTPHIESVAILKL